MKQYTRIKAVIDLDAIKENMEQMHANLKKGTQMIAVVKTDAYGHGAGPIARMLEQMDYVWGYAVATVEEGIHLRKEGVKKPILCLGGIFPEQMEEVLHYEIRMTVYDYHMAEVMSEKAVSEGKKAYIHVKLDTGMSRLGFPVSEESIEAICKIAALPGLEPEGLYTHFSKADEYDKQPTRKQAEGYLWMKDKLQEKGVTFTYYHCSNSAGILDMPEVNMDLVRAGIAMYGLYPSNEVDKRAVSLKPAMQIFAQVTHVKWIEKGTQVSYGGTFEAEERMRVATISIGYGDGYPRSLSNKGIVLLHGKMAPILGRVCMDQMMVDVTQIPDTAFGDWATIAGESEDAFLSVDTLSELSGRFNYEFICDINKRVPREYVMDGKIVEQTDCF